MKENSERKHKKDVEQSVCQKFLTIYNSKNGCNVVKVRAGDPNKNEPDFVCSEGVNVEVTNLYANERDAEESNKMVYGKMDRGTRPLGPSDFIETTHKNSHITLKDLKKYDKLNKGNYAGCEGKIYLVCNLFEPRSAAGFSLTLRDLTDIKKDIAFKLIERNYKEEFDDVFILYDELHNEPGVEKIFSLTD